MKRKARKWAIGLGVAGAISACASSAKMYEAKRDPVETGVMGTWKLAGLLWNGVESKTDASTTFTMNVNADSVAFARDCGDKPLRVTTPAQLSAGAITLGRDADTSCAQDGGEVWREGKRLYEIDGDTMKFYPEEDKGKGYWLWRR